MHRFTALRTLHRVASPECAEGREKFFRRWQRKSGETFLPVQTNGDLPPPFLSGCEGRLRMEGLPYVVKKILVSSKFNSNLLTNSKVDGRHCHFQYSTSILDAYAIFCHLYCNESSKYPMFSQSKCLTPSHLNQSHH